MVMIGMPKTDPLVDGSLDRDTIIRSLGLSGQRPIVLYASTWRKEASLNTVGEEFLAVMKNLDVDFLVKPHDLLLDPATNRKDWGRRLA
jgi:CDP-glycerol glycerophosphotransferase (TagB/SpsB family)